MTSFDELIADLPDVELPTAVQERHLAFLAALPEFEAADADPQPFPAGDGAGADTGAVTTSSPEAVVVDLDRQRRRRRRRILAGGLSIAVVMAGTGTAAAFGLFGTVTNTETAYCYGSANLSENPGNRMEFATEGTDDHPRDAAAAGLDICAAYWRSGVFQLGKPGDVNRAPTGGSYPVPPLVACVLPSGQAGIFPGDSSTCESLGLQNYRQP